MGIELGEKIDSGGTGTVYEGPDNSVYKVAYGNVMTNGDLIRELSMLSRVQGIKDFPSQRTISAGRIDGKCFIQMQRIDGTPLDQFASDWAPTYDEFSTIKQQIADIFEQLGQAGLYHGDATGTGNYIIEETEAGIKVHIIDFVEGGIDESGETARQEAKEIDEVLTYMQKLAKPSPQQDASESLSF